MTHVEQWRPVVGYEDAYLVSDSGIVFSVAWATPLVPFPNDSGYPSVHLRKNGRRKRRTVHSIMAEAFIGPRPEGQQVRHLNGNRSDHRLENLAYGTPGQNQRDAVAHGTHHWASKTTCPEGHPYDAVTPQGARYCKTCKRQKTRERRERLRRKNS